MSRLKYFFKPTTYICYVEKQGHVLCINEFTLTAKIYEPCHEKNLSYAICDKQRRRSACASAQALISAFVVRCQNSTIPLVSIFAISVFSLASVAEQAGLDLTWSDTPKTGFLVAWLNYNWVSCLASLSIYLNGVDFWTFGRVSVSKSMPTYPPPSSSQSRKQTCIWITQSLRIIDGIQFLRLRTRAKSRFRKCFVLSGLNILFVWVLINISFYQTGKYADL